MKNIEVPTKRGSLLDGVLFCETKNPDSILISITGIHGRFKSNPFYINIGHTLNKGNIDLGPFSFRIINTYGHTLDSVSYYFEKDNKIFTGDFIFKGTIGNFDDENMYTMFESIYGFKNLDSSIKIYPGHGDDTTVGYELETNPFLKGF